VQYFNRFGPMHRNVLVLGLFLALAVRLLVPSGFMPVFAQGSLSIVPCSGLGPIEPIAAGMSGSSHHMDAGTTRHPGKEQGGKAEAPCAFAGTAMPAVGGADPAQLAAALVAILILGFARTSLAAPRRPARLRPPLRGPPVPAC